MAHSGSVLCLVRLQSELWLLGPVDYLVDGMNFPRRHGRGFPSFAASFEIFNMIFYLLLA